MLDNVKAIIYDFDGVICDSINVKTEAFAAMYEQYGTGIRDQVVNYHLEHGGISRFEKIRYYQEQLLNLPVTEPELLDMGDKFASLVKHKVIAANYIEGADIFIRKHSGRLKQFICTGTPEYEILEIVDAKGITGLFHGIYGSPKQKTEIITDILNETGLGREQVIYFGDALTDYKAATTCGVPFVGILNEATIFPAGTTVIKDFTELL